MNVKPTFLTHFSEACASNSVMTPAARKAAQQAEAQRQAREFSAVLTEEQVNTILRHRGPYIGARRLGPGPDRPVVQAN